MKFFRVIKSAAVEFIADKGMKLSAALAYYTVFSIGPVLVIIISLAGLFYGREAVQGTIYFQINDFIGNSAALQVQEIIQNIEKSQLGASGAMVGFIVLLVGATGVFTEMQDSINYIWSIKAKPKRGIVKLLTDRLISFSLILSFGFVMLVSLIINAFVDILQKQLMVYFDAETVYIFQIVNYIVLFAIITVLFAIIFKVLPDATIRWRDAFIGAAFTAVLFLIGKFLIGFYLSHSRIGETYGAAASILLVLLWVYYTSIILFFGAEFTKVYTLNYGGGIEPNKTAVFILKREAKELDYEKLDAPEKVREAETKENVQHGKAEYMRS
jgi:membrane protein